MKKIVSLLLVALLAMGTLAACGGNGGASTPATSEPAASSPALVGSAADYKAVLQATRDVEMNEHFAVVTSAEEDAQTNFIEFIGLNPKHMQRYAISVSVIIVQAYGIAIILPQPGYEQEIKDALQAFINTQKQGFDGYLQDQYEIANSAIIDEAPTGEILLVMTADSATVMQELKDGLAA